MAQPAGHRGREASGRKPASSGICRSQIELDQPGAVFRQADDKFCLALFHGDFAAGVPIDGRLYV
jgi:hypothetical protein